MLKRKPNTGQYDRMIIIQEPVNTNDEYNQPEPTSWTTFTTVWAIVEDKSGSESYQADQLTASRTTVFTIRYLSGVTELMRVLFNDRYYDIQWLKYPDRNRTIEIGALIMDDPTEVVTDGIFDRSFDPSFN